MSRVNQAHKWRAGGRESRERELQLRAAVFGNKLFQAEQAAFHYSELSRENISSAKKECTSFVITELSTVYSWMEKVNEYILNRP